MGDALRILFSGVNGFCFVSRQSDLKTERGPSAGEAGCGYRFGVWGNVEGNEENEGLVTSDVARGISEKREAFSAFSFFARSELNGSITPYFRVGWGDIFWRMDSCGLEGLESVE